MAAGNPPDTWQVHPGCELFGQYVEAGYCVPVTDLYQSEGWDRNMPQDLLEHHFHKTPSGVAFGVYSCPLLSEAGLMKWLNEPPVWQADKGRLRVATGPTTDFWRLTHYSFVRDNGHFYHEQRDGDFTIQAKIEGKYEALYDQAGVMIRLDSANWIKAGVEYTDGLPHFSVVVTRDFSDWSLLPADSTCPAWLRLTKSGSAIRIQYSVDGLSFRMLRLAYFPEASHTQVGLMCCSPEREGFEVEFSSFHIGEPITEGLHE